MKKQEKFAKKKNQIQGENDKKFMGTINMIKLYAFFLSFKRQK